MIRITADRPHGNALGKVSITDSDGAPVLGVTGLRIEMSPYSAPLAVLDVLPGAIDVWAQPALTLPVLRECAAAHGLRLVPIGDS
jgi:hypothetical protein